MKQLREKWNSQNGASILLALLFLLVCVTASASVLLAAVSNAGKGRSNYEEQQKYLALSSALRLAAGQISDAAYTGAYSVQRWTVPVYDDDGEKIDETKYYHVQQTGGHFTCGLFDGVLDYTKELDGIYAKEFTGTGYTGLSGGNIAALPSVSYLTIQAEGGETVPDGTGKEESPDSTGKEDSTDSTGKEESPDGTGKKDSTDSTGKDESPSGTGKEDSTDSTGKEDSPDGTEKEEHPNIAIKEKFPDITIKVSLRQDLRVHLTAELKESEDRIYRMEAELTASGLPSLDFSPGADEFSSDGPGGSAENLTVTQRKAPTGPDVTWKLEWIAKEAAGT